MMLTTGQGLTEFAPPQIAAGEGDGSLYPIEMSWLFSIWNGGAAGERLIAKSRLPVSGDDELGTVQE